MGELISATAEKVLGVPAEHVPITATEIFGRAADYENLSTVLVFLKIQKQS